MPQTQGMGYIDLDLGVLWVWGFHVDSDRFP